VTAERTVADGHVYRFLVDQNVKGPIGREVDVYVAISRGREMATLLGFNEIDRTPNLAIVFIDLAWVVAWPAALHFGRGEAEDEDILPAHLFHDFHVGAVQNPNGQGSVELQLHVTRARRFGPRQGDLLAEIRGGNDQLGARIPPIPSLR